MSWLVLIAVISVYIALLAWLFNSSRKWSRKARTKRRLLVKEDGQIVSRVVRGRVLVGWPDHTGHIVSGMTARNIKEWSRDYVVIQAAKGKFVVYRFNERVENEPKTGTIEIYDSWRALEAVLPPEIFEEALRESGLKKPSEYKEIAIKL